MKVWRRILCLFVFTLALSAVIGLGCFSKSVQADGGRNSELIAQLPTNLKADFPVACTTFAATSSGIIYGYMPNKYVETDLTNSYYQEILQLTKSIISGCATDTEKAKAIQSWVSSNITYGRFLGIGDHISQIYEVYVNREARCQGYSYLTGLMLYMAGIPNAIAENDVHMWNLALLSGKWVTVDSTWGEFGFDYDDASHGEINYLFFGDGDFCMVVDDASGVKIAGVGNHELERDGFTSVSIPEYVTEIEGYAFRYCRNLKNVTVPGNILSIGNYAFEGCSSLTNATISSGTMVIGSNAFEGCTSLEKVTIPQSVKSIGSGAFSSNDDIVIYGYSGSAAQTYANSKNISFSTVNGKNVITGYGRLSRAVYTISGSAAVYKSPKVSSGVTIVQIPDTIKIAGKTYKVTAVAANAFAGNTNITSVSIGKNVKKIGNNAFSGCTRLQNVTGCASVSVIGNKAFYGCKRLKGVHGFTKVQEIGTGAFYNCVKLDTIGNRTAVIAMPKIKKIGSNAFYRCTAIKKVNLDSVFLESIGAGAFAKCTALTGFTSKSSKLKSIGKQAFYGDKKLKTVTLHSTKLTKSNIKANAFKGIHSKCVFRVPKSKQKAYQKIFLARGAGKKNKISRI